MGSKPRSLHSAPAKGPGAPVWMTDYVVSEASVEGRGPELKEGGRTFTFGAIVEWSSIDDEGKET